MTRYLDAFNLQRPKETHDHVLRRLKRGYLANDEAANFYKERISIEERYAADLAKLTKKHALSHIDKDYLGQFPSTWDQVLGATNEVSNLHFTLARELAEGVEALLRSKGPNGPDGLRAKQMDNEFGRIAKDMDDKMAKHGKAVMKAKKKNGSDKLDKKATDALAVVEHAKEQWTTQARDFLEKYQRLDEERSIALKDALTKSGEVESRCSSGLLSCSDNLFAVATAMDVGADIANFCASKGNSKLDAATIDANLDASSSAATSRQASVVFPTADQSEHPQSELDAEGYTVPPPRPNDTWAAPASSGFDVNNDLDLDGNESSQGQRIKVNIKKEVIEEHPSDSTAALKHFQAMVAAPTSRQNRRMSRNLSVGDSSTPRLSAAFDLQTIGDTAPDNTIKMTSTTPMSSIDQDHPIIPEVSETINVLLRSEKVERFMLMGEVSLSQLPENQAYDTTGTLRLSLKNPSHPVKIVPNSSLVRNPDLGKPDEFVVDLPSLSSANTGSVSIMKYQVDLQDSQQVVPLLVHPLWKCEDNQTSLLLVYRRNPAAAQNISLTDISVLVPIEGSAHIANMQLKPEGLWNMERRAILWKIPDIPIASEPGKLLARFDTTERLTPSTIVIKFSSVGKLISSSQFEIVAEPGEKSTIIVGGVVHTVKSGHYGAN
ncbi:Muniscin C-terminal mu homology domain-containing protein [Phlyctochytrium arcticum]|nr:Muniscin C-terminal mu homology domain-containing protein [Phlyctochytrium arcticum]